MGKCHNKYFLCFYPFMWQMWQPTLKPSPHLLYSLPPTWQVPDKQKCLILYCNVLSGVPLQTALIWSFWSLWSIWSLRLALFITFWYIYAYG